MGTGRHADMHDVDLAEQGIKVIESRKAAWLREGARRFHRSGDDADDFRIRAIDPADRVDMKIRGKSGADDAGANLGFVHDNALIGFR